VADTIAVPGRFNGPPDSANGGYTCGLVAGFVGNPAEVSLRAPPPLERPLEVERSNGSVVVRDGETLVAEARPVELDLQVPGPVGLEAATAGHREGHCRWDDVHPFPHCVVCGPAREEADGFGILAGPVADGALFASDWTPDPSLGDEHGEVRPECVWAALDCPSSSPVGNPDGTPPIVLAQLTARLDRPVEVGRPHVVTSWPIRVDGRKRHAGSAIFTEQGELLAAARALWIELRPNPDD
jgi:hypothetical protein